MKTPADYYATECEEIKGDGFNYGQFQCDDGNSVEGDGCDKEGLVEAGFSCSGGTNLSPDTCVDSLKPSSWISLVSTENEVYIEFSEEVYLQTTDRIRFDEETVLVEVDGDTPPYEFEWSLGDEYNTGTGQ
jgi:cysteine-rich repeat protein